jgi:hypothetical protein
MFAHLTAKAVFAAIVLALAFFGVGFLGMALWSVLIDLLGRAGSYALVGVVFLIPPVVWSLTVCSRHRRAKPDAGNQVHFARTLLAAVAKETPWAAIVGAGLVGVAETLLNRRKSRK